MTTHYPIDIMHPEERKHALTLNLGGRLTVIDRPQVMAIVNATPDSFYAASRAQTEAEIGRRVSEALAEGADMIDVGACSTRPGGAQPPADEEWERLDRALTAVRRVAPDAVVSVDTYRAAIAERSVGEHGVQIVNDISGGTLDAGMFATVARLQVAYVLTHNAPLGGGREVVEVTRWLAERTDALHQMGVCDVVVDPGFGFGKTVEQNHRLLRDLAHIKHEIEAPLLVGLSRKSMVWKPLGITPDESLNATTVLHTLAISNGSDIVRVHDVRAAVEVVKVLGFRF